MNVDTGTATSFVATISAGGWVSAAVAVLGAAASLAGLFRYFALQRGDGPSPHPSPSGSDSAWTPVLGEPER